MCVTYSICAFFAKAFAVSLIHVRRQGNIIRIPVLKPCVWKALPFFQVHSR